MYIYMKPTHRIRRIGRFQLDDIFKNLNFAKLYSLPIFLPIQHATISNKVYVCHLHVTLNWRHENIQWLEYSPGSCLVHNGRSQVAGVPLLQLQ